MSQRRVQPELRGGRLPELRRRALVTDDGSLAAHTSLVAREYAIPAVVSTADATVRLADGQWVMVDGSAGRVEI